MPFADTSVYKVPEGLTDEDVLFLADILPTAFEVGVLTAAYSPGDTVAIVGAGPIGLATIMTAKLFTPGHIVAIDLADARLREGARVRRRHDHQQRHARMPSRGHGADRTDSASTLRSRRSACPRRSSSAPSIVRPGGRVANVGVHGHSGDAPSRDAVDPGHHDHDGARRHDDDPAAAEADRRSGRLDPTLFATHRFALADTEAAYDVFAAAAETHALKVVLTAEPVPLLADHSEAGQRVPAGVA